MNAYVDLPQVAQDVPRDKGLLYLQSRVQPLTGAILYGSLLSPWDDRGSWTSSKYNPP